MWEEIRGKLHLKHLNCWTLLNSRELDDIFVILANTLLMLDDNNYEMEEMCILKPRLCLAADINIFGLMKKATTPTQSHLAVVFLHSTNISMSAEHAVSVISFIFVLHPV